MLHVFHIHFKSKTTVFPCCLQGQCQGTGKSLIDEHGPRLKPNSCRRASAHSVSLCPVRVPRAESMCTVPVFQRASSLIAYVECKHRKQRALMWLGGSKTRDRNKRRVGSGADEVGSDGALMGLKSWLSVLLHQQEKIPFPYLKAIYWVRVQGKSVWVAEWRTECFCGLWISPPPRIRNLILEGNDGISAELLWRGQTAHMALFLSARPCWWTQSALIKDLSTLHIKTVECEAHKINDCGQVRMRLPCLVWSGRFPASKISSFAIFLENVRYVTAQVVNYVNQSNHSAVVTHGQWCCFFCWVSVPLFRTTYSHAVISTAHQQRSSEWASVWTPWLQPLKHKKSFERVFHVKTGLLQ